MRLICSKDFVKSTNLVSTQMLLGYQANVDKYIAFYRSKHPSPTCIQAIFSEITASLILIQLVQFKTFFKLIAGGGGWI